jgi:hypothetical protein
MKTEPSYTDQLSQILPRQNGSPEGFKAMQESLNSKIKHNVENDIRSVFFYMTISPVTKTADRLVYVVDQRYIDSNMAWCDRRLPASLRVNKIGVDSFEVVAK